MSKRIEMAVRRKSSRVEIGLQRGKAKPLQSKSVTPTTQQQTVTPDEGYYGLHEVTVEAAPTQPLTVTPSKAQQIINPDNGYVGFEEVTVEPVTLQDKTVTPTEQVQVVEADEGYDGLREVTVEAVPLQVLQDKTVTPVEATTIEVTADSGYDGLGEVTVNPPTYADLTWIMEARLGNHRVITASDMAKLLPFIEAGGTRYMLSGAIITSIDLSGVTAVGTYGFAHFFVSCTSLLDINFMSLTTTQESYAFREIVSNVASLRYFRFPSLTTVAGTQAFYRACYNCNGLSTIEFPSLTTVSGNVNQFQGTFQNSNNLVNAILHPDCLRYSDNRNIINSATLIRNLTLSQDASTNIYLTWQGNLNFDSIKNIFEHCNNSNMNGKSVTFKAGLTLTDDAEGTLNSLKLEAEQKGCTINNLTINPYTP